MKEVRNSTQVASVLKVTDEMVILPWITTLPVWVSIRTASKVLRKAKGANYILWREDLGFRIFYPDKHTKQKMATTIKTTVVHFKKEPFDIYIGRPSKWGNPYSHKEGTIAEFKVKDRKEAVAKYEQYLLANEELMDSLQELKGKVLGCWCKPQSCHGDILAKYANAKPLF